MACWSEKAEKSEKFKFTPENPSALSDPSYVLPLHTIPRERTFQQTPAML